MHYLLTVARIEIARWLVGKDQLWMLNHGSSNGYTLLLSAGKLVRIVPGSMGDSHAAQYLLYPHPTFFFRQPEISERQCHVFFHIEFVYQVILTFTTETNKNG